MDTLKPGPVIVTISIQDELFPLLTPETKAKIERQAVLCTVGNDYAVAFVGKTTELSDIPSGVKELAARVEEFVAKYDVVGHLKGGFIRYDLNVYDLRPPRTLLIAYLALTLDSYDQFHKDRAEAKLNEEIRA